MESSIKRTISGTKENNRTQPTKKANHKISTDSSDDRGDGTIHSSKTPNVKQILQLLDEPCSSENTVTNLNVTFILSPARFNFESRKVTSNSSKTSSFFSSLISEVQSLTNLSQEYEEFKTPTVVAISAPNIYQ